MRKKAKLVHSLLLMLHSSNMIFCLFNYYRKIPMKLIRPSLFVLFASFTALANDTNAASSPNKQAQNVDFSGFECANNALPIIPLLGRGDDFPNFVALDIAASLKKQSKRAQVVAIECTADVQQQVFTQNRIINGKEQGVITGLEVIIPLTIVVENDKQTTKLAIEQIYKTTNLEQPEARKTVQTFKVLSQQNM